MTETQITARATFEDEPWNAIAYLYQEANKLFGANSAAALTFLAQHRFWAYGA